MSPFTFGVLERDDCVVGEDDVEDQSKVEEPTMSILQNQWSAGLTGVLLMWFGYCTCRW